MKLVVDTRRQLSELCERVGVVLESGGADCNLSLRRALLGGLFVNVAEYVGEGKYKTVSGCGEWVWIQELCGGGSTRLSGCGYKSYVERGIGQGTCHVSSSNSKLLSRALEGEVQG